MISSTVKRYRFNQPIKKVHRSNHQYCKMGNTEHSAQPNMSKNNDEHLMLAFCEGNTDAFNVLYLKHKDSIYRYYLRHTSNNNTAQELFQDLWLKVINSKKQYHSTASFKTWLFTLAHHRLVDWYRRNRLENKAFVNNTIQENENQILNQGSIAWNPEDELLTKRLGIKLKKAIGELPFEQREVFLLHQEASLTLPQIAEMMDEGLEKIKSRYRYAIKKLRTSLGEIT